MAMERVRQEEELLEEMLRKKQIEIQAIARKTEINDINSSAMLRRALERGEILEKQIESGLLDRRA